MIAIFVILAFIIDPFPFVTEQYCVGEEGYVRIVTEYVAFALKAVLKVKLPFP